mmetsp:Transcript_7631/g.18842  ORF Transcript_7631/g.18842 Transcript_7631/m.18842 type:complete len:80 (-) Transcript_7631:2195-2434(-)
MPFVGVSIPHFTARTNLRLSNLSDYYYMSAVRYGFKMLAIGNEFIFTIASLVDVLHCHVELKGCSLRLFIFKLPCGRTY